LFFLLPPLPISFLFPYTTLFRSNTVAPILQKAHARGWKPRFLTVSFVGTDDLILQAGADAEGMVVTQVVPPYYMTDFKTVAMYRSEEHTSELQSLRHLVCRLLLE